MNHASRETCIHYVICEFLVQTYLCKYVYFNVRDFILFLIDCNQRKIFVPSDI